MKKSYTPAEQAENRETLKAALRAHARQFKMSTWISYTGLVAPPTLRSFEACGTACCIDGMAALLWRNVDSHGIGMTVDAACGLPIQICSVVSWDHDLWKRYCSGDQTAKVEAACSQIDRWAPKVAV